MPAPSLVPWDLQLDEDKKKYTSQDTWPCDATTNPIYLIDSAHQPDMGFRP